MATVIIEAQQNADTPYTYTLTGAQTFRPESAFAHFDGTGASGPFLACLTFKSIDGKIFSRTFPSTAIAAGGVADVSYAPFPGGIGTSTQPLPVIDFVQFNPVGGFVAITSTDPDNPDDVSIGNPLPFDGLTTIQLQFGAGTMDIDQRGVANTGALLIELWDNGAPIGIISDFSVAADAYGSVPCYVFTFDTPAAGTHTYAIRSYIQPSGGGTQGSSNIYGADITTPHQTRPGYFAILAA